MNLAGSKVIFISRLHQLSLSLTCCSWSHKWLLKTTWCCSTWFCIRTTKAFLKYFRKTQAKSKLTSNWQVRFTIIIVFNLFYRLLFCFFGKESNSKDSFINSDNGFLIIQADTLFNDREVGNTVPFRIHSIFQFHIMSRCTSDLTRVSQGKENVYLKFISRELSILNSKSWAIFIRNY